MKAFVDSKDRGRYRFRLPLQLFAGEGGGAGGTDGGDGGGSGGTGGAGGGSGGDGSKTFTEAEVQAKIKEATGTAIEKAIKDRFGDLAGMDLKDIRAAVELKKKIDEENNKSKGGQGKEGDDKQPDVDKLIEEKLKAERDKSFKRLLNAEVKLQAAELGFADWEDALALSDLSKVQEDDKGNLTGIKEALEELAKKKPHLLKQQRKGSGTFGAEMPGGGTGGGKASKEDVIKLAQNRGAVPTQTAYDPWNRK